MVYGLGSKVIFYQRAPMLFYIHIQLTTSLFGMREPSHTTVGTQRRRRKHTRAHSDFFFFFVFSTTTEYCRAPLVEYEADNRRHRHHAERQRKKINGRTTARRAPESRRQKINNVSSLSSERGPQLGVATDIDMRSEKEKRKRVRSRSRILADRPTHM